MKVMISGGVHGNELTGVYLVKVLQKQWLYFKNISVDFLLANPKAIEECRRYIDFDLNRSFSKTALEKDSHIYEYERAKVIKQKLQKCDFLIDLHSTTANMGITVVLSSKDKLSENVAKILSTTYDNVKILRWLSNSEGAFINSLVQHSITLEVGPVCQGVLDADLFFETQKVLNEALRVLEMGERIEKPCEAYEIFDAVDFPRKDGELCGMIHPEFKKRDYQLLHRGDPIFITFDGKEIFYEGDEAYGCFINEAAYYEKNMAFCLAKKVII